MKITAHTSSIKTIKSDDPLFNIIDGYVTAPRAGFEISERCPIEYRMIIRECINRGWLKPIANMTEQEMIVAVLRD